MFFNWIINTKIIKKNFSLKNTHLAPICMSPFLKSSSIIDEFWNLTRVCSLSFFNLGPPVLVFKPSLLSGSMPSVFAMFFYVNGVWDRLGILSVCGFTYTSDYFTFLISTALLSVITFSSSLFYLFVVMQVAPIFL